MIKLLIAALCCGCFLSGCIDPVPQMFPETDDVADDPVLTEPHDVAVDPLLMIISCDLNPLKVGDVRDVIVHIRYGEHVPITNYMTVHLPEEIDLVGEEGGKRQRQYEIEVPPSQDVHLRFKVLRQTELHPASDIRKLYVIRFRQSVRETEPHELPPNPIGARMGNVVYQEHTLYAALDFKLASDE